MAVPIKFVPNVMKGAEKRFIDDDHAIYLRLDLPPGAATFIDSSDGRKNTGLNYVCPCGCGFVGCLPLCQGKKLERHWLWNGNTEKPTLSPSISRTAGCMWHGFLTKGEWKAV